MSVLSYISRNQLRERALIVLLLVLASVLAFPAKARAQEELPEALRVVFAAGVAAEKAGRWEEAEQDFQLVIARGGKVASAYSNLGILYQRRGDHPRAIAQFREAIQLQPDYFAPHVLLGASLLAAARVQEAVRVLERAVKLDPRQTMARAQLAKAYERDNNLSAMLDQYRVLRELAPRDPEYNYQVGQAYLKVAQWALERMQRLAPQSSRVYESRADAYRAQGLTEQAIRAYQLAGDADPKLPGIHLALAQIYLEQKRIEEARHAIEQELTIVPESVAARAIQQRIASAKSKP